MASEWQVLLFCLAVVSICMVLVTAALLYLIVSFSRTLRQIEALIPQAERLLHHSNRVADEIDSFVGQTHEAAAAVFDHLSSFIRNTRAFLSERLGLHHRRKLRMRHR